MRNDIINLILEASEELNYQLEKKIAIDQGENASLYGLDGVLDSLGLVNLVIAVEQAVEDKYNKAIILVDEAAMSQKQSPFRTIGLLADYANKLIQGDDV